MLNILYIIIIIVTISQFDQRGTLERLYNFKIAESFQKLLVCLVLEGSK